MWRVVLVAYSLLIGCESQSPRPLTSEPPPKAAPPQVGSADNPRPDAANPVAGPKASGPTAPDLGPFVKSTPTPVSGGDDGPILWVREIPGYVPVELADQYQRYPYRFQLFADGRVIFRDAQFQHRRVTLSDPDRTALLKAARQARILHLTMDPETPPIAVADVGRVVVGFRDGALQSELILEGGPTFLSIHYPKNAVVQHVTELVALCQHYDNADAEAFDY